MDLIYWQVCHPVGGEGMGVKKVDLFFQLLVYRQIKCNIQIMLEMSQVHNKFVKSVDLLYLCMHIVILVIKIHLA